MQQIDNGITRFAFTQVEDTSDLLNIYIGKTTLASAAFSSAVWQIQRISIVSAGVTKLEFANNDASANYVWDDRASYFGAPAGGSFLSRYSIQFDGSNDYMDCGQGSDLRFRSALPFTISAWINPDNLSTTRTIFSQYTSAGCFLYLTQTTGKLRFRIVVTATSNDLSVETVGSIVLGTWTHVAVTYDGSRAASGVILYVNGVAVAVNVVSNTLSSSPSTTVTWKIGATGAASTYFSGYIDDVSIWDSVLNGSQISSIYGIGKPKDLSLFPFYTSCIGWWLMGDGATYPNIVDVAKGNTGVMTNMTSGQIIQAAP